MSLIGRNLVAWVLIWCLLLIGALAYPQAVAHATNHAHHQAATHSSVLCSWMCAAGQMLAAIQPTPQVRVDVLVFDLPIIFEEPSSQAVESPTSRGPPRRLPYRVY